MPSFSESDINAAKRRVQEMRNRAQRFADEDSPPQPARPESRTSGAQSEKDVKAGNNTDEEEENSKSEEKSFFVILALIFLLSKEGADNTLILALLYLLL